MKRSSQNSRQPGIEIQLSLQGRSERGTGRWEIRSVASCSYCTIFDESTVEIDAQVRRCFFGSPFAKRIKKPKFNFAATCAPIFILVFVLLSAIFGRVIPRPAPPRPPKPPQPPLLPNPPSDPRKPAKRRARHPKPARQKKYFQAASTPQNSIPPNKIKGQTHIAPSGVTRTGEIF